MTTSDHNDDQAYLEVLIRRLRNLADNTALRKQLAAVTVDLTWWKAKCVQGVNLHGQSKDMWGWHYDVRGALGLPPLKEIEPIPQCLECAALREQLAAVTKERDAAIKRATDAHPQDWRERAPKVADNPLLKSNDDVETIFRMLARKWFSETGMLSNPNEKFRHINYQQIIGLGPQVVPFMLAETAKGYGSWFWALNAITRDNPVLSSDAGNTQKMAASWVEWGQRKGYLDEAAKVAEKRIRALPDETAKKPLNPCKECESEATVIKYDDGYAVSCMGEHADADDLSIFTDPAAAIDNWNKNNPTGDVEVNAETPNLEGPPTYPTIQF